MKSFLAEIGGGFADVLRAIARKDLTEPAYLNALLDVSTWIVVIILAITPFALKNSSVMFYLAFALTLICVGWCIFHYTVLRIHRRQ